MKSTGLALTAVGLLLFAFSAHAQDAGHGAEDYKLCAGCHGFVGEGNALVGAPALAGQESWYLERQVRNFRTGLRGHSGDDTAGQTMATMVRGLRDDEAIRDVVAHIGTLPAPSPKKTLQGDVDKGKVTYSTCAACHGLQAEGNPALNAPSLVAVDDWYQLSQLRKFKAGARGGSAQDTYGQQMAPMAAVLTDEKAMKNVIAYISSLR
jgi:cytochrome c oxidase subunit 2